MTRILVYEFVSAGGLSGGDAQAESELLPAGRSMRNAMVSDLLAWGGCEVSVADSAVSPLAGAGWDKRQALRRVRAAPGQDPTAFIATQMAQHDLAWVVAPEGDGLLARCQEVVGDARWLGCDAAALRVASSKQRTLAALAAVGAATPLDFSADPQTGRWVVKPDDGAGAVDTLSFTDRATAEAHAADRRAAGQAVVLEPWVPGEALSLSLLVEGDGSVGARGPRVEVLSVNQQDIALTAGGQVRFDGVRIGSVPPADPRLPALQHLAERTVAAVPGLRGFVGIDLVWHARRGPVLIEVNPRLTCAYVGQSEHLGRNLAAAMVIAHRQRTASTRREAHATA